MRRLAVALVLLGTLLAVPVGVLVVRALESAEIEEASRHRAIAERAFDEMEESLSRLLEEEEARPFDAYRFYSQIEPGPDGSMIAATRSPLADPPEHDFVIGYFQIDPDGSLHTPRIPRDPALARERGDFQPAPALRQLEQTLRDAWARRQPASGRLGDDLAARDGKGKDAGQGAEKGAGQGAEKDAGKSEGEADEAETRAEGPARPSPARSPLANAPAPALEKQSVYDVYRSLNRGSERRADRKQKVTRVPAPEIPPLPEDHFRLAEVKEAGTAAAVPRDHDDSTRQAGAPTAVALPGSRSTSGTIRVALDPMVGRQAGDGRILLYRTVLVGEQGYRQGLLIDWRRLGTWLEAQVIAPSALRSARVVVRGTTPNGDNESPVPAGETYTYTHRFAEPFDAFGIELGLPRLPGGRGIGTIHALAALLAVVAAGGLFAVYRMVAVVVQFADRRNRFVAAVSHELKTPLTAIRMYGEMLRDGLVANDAKREEYYRTITDESERLSRLIDNVLDFSRLEKGEHDAAAHPVDAGTIVRTAVEKLQPHAGRVGFALEVDVDAGLPRVAFDEDVLTQVIFNLVDNAIKYARDAGAQTIGVGCHLPDGSRHVEVSVRDHGPGVPAHDMDRIFEPFYRRGDELTRATKGTGIGLALVKELVESLGGRVEAVNAPGGGLRVSVELPLASPV